MLFAIFLNCYTVHIGKPGNATIVYTSSYEMVAIRGDILVCVRVFILSYTHFSLYFGEVMAGLKPALLLLQSSD